jgi:hypothetical protein
MSPDKNHSQAPAKGKSATKKNGAKKTVAQQAARQDAPGKHVRRHAPEERANPRDQPEDKPREKEKKAKSGKDLRRAYEHLARVRVLLMQTGGDAKLRAAAARLAVVAAEDMVTARAGPKLLAELTLAAEHMAFAGLVGEDVQALPWSPEIEQALEDEYKRLRGEAELPEAASRADGTRAEALRSLHELMTETAEGALGEDNHSCAMECIRAAVALAAALEHDNSEE